MINDVVQLEGESNSNLLIVSTLLKDVRNKIWIDFPNILEKYMFKTLVFNHLVSILQ